MEHYTAKKVVILTEKIITEQVTSLIEKCGATGYTISSCGGKGSRGIRNSDRETVSSEAFSNVKIEVITASREQANEIADKVAEKFFENYSGITYLQDVEILRPQKF